MVNSTFRMSLMLRVGSPSTNTRSASLPGARDPSRSSICMMRAAPKVANCSSGRRNASLHIQFKFTVEREPGEVICSGFNGDSSPVNLFTKL